MTRCTDEAHEERRRTGDLDNVRPWPGEDFDIGECPECHSTLAVARREVADAA